MFPKSIQKAIEEFAKLPGIGPKTAGRLVFHLIRRPNGQAEELGGALKNLMTNLVFCETCFNVAEETPCQICSSSKRDKSVVCVVEQPLDTLAVEKTEYNGLYHVLGGVISPIDGVSAEDLKLSNLIDRITLSAEIEELILATNPSLEGEATAMYIQRLVGQNLPKRKIKISRIAHGLPMGGDLEYADHVTLTRALEGRREMVS